MKKRQHTWGKTLKRAGITRRLRPYDLRHYFVTKALEDGADIKALAEVVGAARLQTRRLRPYDLRHYCDQSPCRSGGSRTSPKKFTGTQ